MTEEQIWLLARLSKALENETITIETAFFLMGLSDNEERVLRQTLTLLIGKAITEEK